jgi:integrase
MKKRYIKVTLSKPVRTPYWRMEWRDNDGKSRGLSTKKKLKGDAKEVASKHEYQLNRDEIPVDEYLIEDAKEEYYSAISLLREKSKKHIKVSLKQFATYLPELKKLDEITFRNLSEWVNKQHEKKLAIFTISSRMADMRKFLRWCISAKLISKLPDFPTLQLPKGYKGKGRSITPKQFEQVIKAIPKIETDKSRATAYKNFLYGIYHTGLRIQNLLDLSWDERDPIHINFPDSGRPTFIVDHSVDKAKQNRVAPCTPQFAEFLTKTFPKSSRYGKVFKMPVDHPDTIGDTIREIGIASGVKVNGCNVTAHIIRKTFGNEWAKKLAPAELKTLMWHADIKTTMTFYVDIEANDVQDKLWQMSK